MSNIMSQLKLRNKPSRDGFDLSRKNAFTAKVGELLPVACIECLPGDKFKGHIQHFTRTMPVNTAAFTRMREYYDWFFVPTNLLWNKFNTFVTQMTDNNQHALGISSNMLLSDTHPYFTSSDIQNYLIEFAQDSKNNNNIFNFNRAKLTAKLLHYLGYGDYSSFADGTTTSATSPVLLNPFPLLAYQKIYQDYFRNSQWEQAWAPSFNIDYLGGNSLQIPVTTLYNVPRVYENMFDLRYSNWNKDKFMGLQPNAQYGSTATITGTENILLQVTTATGLPPSNIAIKTSNNVYDTYRSVITDGSNTGLRLNVEKFNILALRQAEALQKWQEITQSQQQDYKNQIEAHFGVSVSDAYSERCQYVDGSVSNLDISEVTNTNITADNAADIAGKGVGVGDGKFDYEAKVHGYLMCIYHAVPMLDYASDGIGKMNLKTKVTDYAIPEFDKTGMVSVPRIELTGSVTSMPDLLGYAPRYYDYKLATDEVHGAFVNGGLGAWVAPIDKNYLTKYAQSMFDSNSLTFQFFKVNPSVLNPIFAIDATSDTDSDQLLVNASFDISAVRNLDRNGLPY